ETLLFYDGFQRIQPFAQFLIFFLQLIKAAGVLCQHQRGTAEKCSAKTGGGSNRSVTKGFHNLIFDEWMNGQYSALTFLCLVNIIHGTSTVPLTPHINTPHATPLSPIVKCIHRHAE